MKLSFYVIMSDDDAYFKALPKPRDEDGFYLDELTCTTTYELEEAEHFDTLEEAQAVLNKINSLPAEQSHHKRWHHYRWQIVKCRLKVKVGV